MESTPHRQATVRDLVAVLFRQKYIILTVFSVTTLAVVLLNLRSPTTYESEGRVKVERGRKESVTAPGVSVRVLPWKEEISSEIETVKSYPVARDAQVILDTWHEEGTIGRPVRIHRGGVQAGVVGESNILVITYASQDASVCQPATAAVMEAYTKFRQKSHEFGAVKGYFEAELTQVRAEVRALQDERERILAQLGPGGASSREAGVANLLMTCDHEIIEAETRYDLVQQYLETSRAMVASGNIDAAYFAQVEYKNAYTLNQLREQANRARMERDELSATLTAQHPELKRAESALASAQSMLDREIQETIRLMEQELLQLQSKLVTARGHQERLRAELTLIPAARVELDRINEDIRLANERRSDLEHDQVASATNINTSPDYTVTTISPSGAPYPLRTRDYVRMALAPIMSLVVGLLLAFFVDSLDHSLRTPRDAEDYLGVPVLASLPETRR